MKMSKAALVGQLLRIAALIESDDSFEGFIRWGIADDAKSIEVFGVYRYGNREGQGCMHIIDTEPSEEVSP